MPKLLKLNQKAPRFGRIETIVLLTLAFIAVFVGVDWLAHVSQPSGESTDGTGFMVRMRKPILRAYNGVVRPGYVKQPIAAQTQPDVYPQIPGIGGSTWSTPEPIAPYKSYQGY